ncbi:hypothetical protein EX30DRAFT_334671 [Ascodesmis nigricans]|uniref:DUF2433 domain-containing protein n=1 Tax=Ascodesmis nigricans TaxID=341454 RepID=A0A4S2MMD3_9PEZI|nr:hypothetical protein EX30DRAFT_334671 [Ascodesmis nigricans]
MATNPSQQPRPLAFSPHQQHFLPNGMSSTVPQPAAIAGLPPTKVIEKNGARVLCIADVRGHLRTLNELAKKANADHIVHTGDFGFYDDSSLDRIAEKTLKHVIQYSPLLDQAVKSRINNNTNIKQAMRGQPNALSELPLFLAGKYTLDVPVYTVWGACEDVGVLEKFRSGEYKVNNLHIIDEANSRLLDVGGVKLRLLGLGGAVVMHKLFDNGEGKTTIAGGQGTMWTTLLQMGELVDTANRVYDPSETRIFITHNSPAREGLLNQLSVTLKADFSISAGLHFRYGSSYNEFSVNPSLDHYRGKLASSKASFNDVWETVKGEVQPAVQNNPSQDQLLKNALAFIDKMPTNANGGNPFGGPSANSAPGAGILDESAFKNMWNFNLADAAFGWLVLEIEGGRIGTEMRAQGFNFAHRCGRNQQGGHTPAQPGLQQQQQQLQAQISAAAPPAQSPAPASPAVPTGPRANVPVQQAPKGASPSLQPAAPQQSSASPRPSPKPRKIEPAVPELPISKPSTPRPAPSPAPQAEKPAEPKPEATSNGNNEAEAAKPPVAPVVETLAAAATPEAPQTPASPSDQPPTTTRPKQFGLFINNVSGTDAALELLPADYRSQVNMVEKRANKSGLPFWLAFTQTEELAKEIYAKLPEELKAMGPDRRAPFVKLMESETRGMGARRGGREGMGASRWSRDGGNTSESDGQQGRRGGRKGFGRGGFERGMGRGRGGQVVSGV